MLQSQIVFDDAVMHHDDVAVAVAVRVRIFFGGPAVGRPAGVADPVSAVHRVQPQRVFQVAQLALRAPDPQAVVLSSTAIPAES